MLVLIRALKQYRLQASNMVLPWETVRHGRGEGRGGRRLRKEEELLIVGAGMKSNILRTRDFNVDFRPIAVLH